MQTIILDTRDVSVERVERQMYNNNSKMKEKGKHSK